jgi:hypothetical protein
MGGAGILMQVMGSQQEAQASATEAQFERAVALSNARVARQAAADTRVAGHEAEEAYLQRVRGLTGTQRATFAANGVEQSGTALDVMAESAGQGAADASRIRSNAIREAWGYEVEGQNQDARAAFAKYSGKAAKRGGILTGGAQILGGGYSLMKGK